MSSSTVRYRSDVVRLATRLYLEEGLSCRRVASRLRECGVEPAPSHMTIDQWLRASGVLRTKSAALRTRADRERGRDYTALEQAARDLARRGWSMREIARRLGVSRSSVARWLPRPLRATPAEAQIRSKWFSPRPETAARQERLRRALELKVAGRTYASIAAELGVSVPTLCLWFKRQGLTRGQRRTCAAATGAPARPSAAPAQEARS